MSHVQPTRLRLCSLPGSGRGSHCTTCSISPQCPLQEVLPAHPSSVRPLRCHGQRQHTHPRHTGQQRSPAASPAPHKPTGAGSSYPRTPSETPSLCTQGTCARGADVLGPRSGLSLMDLGELKLSELPTSASAAGKRTAAHSFCPGLYSGAPALSAQHCSDHSFEWMFLQTH